MADALKAEGNKLFAEKKFAESMYVPDPVQRRSSAVKHLSSLAFPFCDAPI
jgi:hypothetical protein